MTDPSLRSRRPWLATVAVLALALLGIGLVLSAWDLPPFRSALEVTENAYVRGPVTVIAPKVDGYVTAVLVADYAPVRAGEVLVRLDDRQLRQKLEQARAQLQAQEAQLRNQVQVRQAREAGVASADAVVASAEAQRVNAAAQLTRGRADRQRADGLLPDGAVSEREHDQLTAALRQAEAAARQAEAALRQARAAAAAARQELRGVIVGRDALEAAVAAARAAVELASIDLDNTSIRAPRDGYAGEVGVKLGQYVTPGTQLLALVPAERWVVANFKEAQTARIAPGQRASLRVDALDGAALSGRVVRLAPATGSEFSVIRPDNATGNFTKVPQRLPVRIELDADDALVHRLRPGMSVVASVDTTSSAR